MSTDASGQEHERAGSEEHPGTHVVTGRLFRRRKGHGWAFAEEPEPPPPEPVRRPARVAQMLAFAHSLQAAIDRGDYRDQADAARQLGLTRARVTQLMNLTLLAPEIQESVLFLEAVDGREPLSERELRRVLGSLVWEEQIAVWADLNVRRAELRPVKTQPNQVRTDGTR